MKVIYKYLTKFKEPLYISLVLMSIIIILKLLKRNLIEGHEEHSYVSHSKKAERGCDSPLDWEFSEITELLKKLEKIQIKRYTINLYRQAFQEMINDGTIIWTNELVMAYLQSDHIDGPEYQLIEKKAGLYDLILDYAENYEKKKTDLISSGKWAKIEDSAMLLSPNEIMQIMVAAELDIGYILFESYKKGTPAFRALMLERDYKTTFKTNKINSWNSRNTSVFPNNDAPWNDGNEWITSAYEKYSNSTSGQGSSTTTTCDMIIGEEDCQMCNPTEQIACWKKKWLEQDALRIKAQPELDALNTELKLLKDQEVTKADYEDEVYALQTQARGLVANCNSLMGYGEAGMDNVSTEKDAEGTGTEWCATKMDKDGNWCQFKKVKKKGNAKWKIFCSS